MKILQVIPCFSPPNLFGGSQRVAYLLSKGLVKKGHEVIIYTSDLKNLKERTDKSIEYIDDIKIVHFKTISPFLLNREGLIITPRMFKILIKTINHFDLIHIHEARSFQHMVIWWIARRRDIPFIIQGHGLLNKNFGGLLRKAYDGFFNKNILRDAKKVIAVNKIETNDFPMYKIPKEKIEIIPNGIDLSEYFDLPAKGAFKKKIGIDKDDKIILYLGRIHRIKGIDVLVKAFASVIRKLDDVRLVIVGPDDGYLSKIQTLVENLRIVNNVIFTGPLYGSEKIEAYVDADVYVLPSRYEIFGLSVIEAYSCGKPVIASRVGGLKDLVLDGVTGLLFTNENIGQLAESLLFILDDNTRAAKMGLKGKQFVKDNFKIEKSVDRLEILYKKIAKLVHA